MKKQKKESSLFLKKNYFIGDLEYAIEINLNKKVVVNYTFANLIIKKVLITLLPLLTAERGSRKQLLVEKLLCLIIPIQGECLWTDFCRNTYLLLFY